MDRRFLQGALHALHLAVDPGMIGHCQSVVDSVVFSDTANEVHEAVLLSLQVGELNTVAS